VTMDALFNASAMFSYIKSHSRDDKVRTSGLPVIRRKKGSKNRLEHISLIRDDMMLFTSVEKGKKIVRVVDMTSSLYPIVDVESVLFSCDGNVDGLDG
jgi:hypothetical protein